MNSMPNLNLNTNHLKSNNNQRRFYRLTHEKGTLTSSRYLPIYSITYWLTIDGLFVDVSYFQFQPSLKLNLPRLKLFQPEFQIYL